MERFDAYLRDEMNAADRQRFEEEINQNALLKNEFLEYQSFLNDLNDGAAYAEIRQTLRIIHNKPGIIRKPFLLSPQFLIPVSIAASIGLLFILVDPFVKEGNGTATNNDYQYLQHTPAATEATEAPDLATDSTASTEAFHSNDQKYPGSPEFLTSIKTVPTGTAFLISDQGYFLTSKHLVSKHHTLILQQKDDLFTFETSVVYTDSLLDFAILQCHPEIAQNFEPVPFRFLKSDIELGQDVFTLGYPKNEIVYTKGVVSSEKGYHSDTLSYEVSLPSNPGYSGAPLFNYEGDLIGIVTANNSRQQAVTYVLNQHYIAQTLQNLHDHGTLDIDLQTNFTRRYKQHANLVKAYRSFIFEVHLPN